MDYNYEFLVFQHANHDTKEKLEYYPNFIMILLGELKTLRETMCASCQKKRSSSKTTGSGNQLLATSTDSTIAMRLPNRATTTLPQMPKTKVKFWQTPTPSSSSLPLNETIASDSSSLTTEESDNPIFYAERDALADTTLEVTFAHSFRHKDVVVSCVCFSPDGRYLAVATEINDGDSSIIFYDVASRKKYCELKEYATQYGRYTRPVIYRLCFNSSGRYLAAADSVGRIIIWDIPNKRMRSVFQWRGWPYGLRFSPDGRLVTLSTEAGLVVLNMRDNSRKLVSEGRRFDFSPNGRYIAAETKGVLVTLNVRTGKEVKRWNGHGTYLKIVKFTLDGRGLLCVYSDKIEQWDVSEEPFLIRKLDFKSYFYSSSISPDHRLVALNHELCDADSLKRQFSMNGHTNTIFSVDFSAAGPYLAIGASDGFASLWKYNWT